MKFLVDAQLPPALAAWLRDAGHEAEHVEAAGLRDADDRAIWAHARRTGAAVLTKDEDFAAASTRAPGTPVIVWLRVGNTTNRALKAWMESRLPALVKLAEEGNRLIEVI